MDSLQTDVAHALADEGPLARVLDGFEPRPGQRAMAAAVAETFSDGGILMAEAGTGTGKTLAYLVPAIFYGRRVLVSTGTRNLQEQIVQKDVPLLQRALEVPFSVACMKGRGNYLCLHRFDQARAGVAPRSVEDVRTMAVLDAWLAHTDTGDRAELGELPDDLPLWHELSATTENCLGSECPRLSDCFVTRMRERAAEADIVVVNHHLLCADAAVRHHSFGEVIPECRVAVIDEAHQLEDVATQYFGVGVSTFRLEELVRDGGRALVRGGGATRDQLDAIRRAIARVDQRGRGFFVDLQRRRAGTSAATASAPIGLLDERRRVTADDLEPVAESGLDLIGALTEVEATVALAPEATEDLRAVGHRATELRDTLRFLLLASDPAFVYFVEVRGRGVFLRAMPIDVSAIVSDLLFDRMHATVLTSATLATGGRFDYIRERLGVADARELRLPSEFDHAQQSLLYLPRRMPDPRSDAFLARAAEEIRDILTRSQGRAFVLFTSYAALRQVQQRLGGSLPYPILVQGEAPRSHLLEQFKTTPHAVLLATASFWQGVDVVGDALSCVIIDKLPFASPSDPVVEARIEALAAKGGDPFGQYQVPLAILTLLQGLGRLLRHRSDRGVLAILDPRLRTMGYGRRFLQSLPPSPVTHDIEAIARFFASR